MVLQVFSRYGSARAGSVAATVVAVLLVAGPAAWAQRELTDDAGRRVHLPDRITRVFAAGAPAEVLLYTLVPEMLVGRNHMPTAAALAFVPPELRAPIQVVNLPDRDDPQYDAELLALDPDVLIDYGTVDDDYVAALEAISARTNVPAVIFDGRLTQIPAVYRRLGAALGVPARGEQLAAESERILAKYRNALADPAVRVYAACSATGTTPCLRGTSGGEVLEVLGALNVAGTIDDAPRRLLTPEQVGTLAPDVLVAVSASAADRLASDPGWAPVLVRSVLHAPPEVPFNWGPRPPSVNRLLGLVWLAHAVPGRTLSADFFADAQRFFATFYHVRLSEAELRELLGER
jgi:iron complex transport system substrate-binding protein